MKLLVTGGLGFIGSNFISRVFENHKDWNVVNVDAELYGSNQQSLKKFEKGSKVKLLLQPDDLRHDDKSDLKLQVVDRKFRGTEFIYLVNTDNNDLIPISVVSHHGHYHEINDKFGIKKPIFIDHLVCFN